MFPRIIQNDAKILSIRFAINAGVTILKSDLNAPLALINGIPVGAIVK